MNFFFLLSVVIVITVPCKVCSGELHFVSQPVDNIVPPNHSAFLNCNANGSSTISWFKDTTNAQLSSDHKYILHNDSRILEIVDFASADNGEYYCTASNDMGSIRSLNAKLLVAVIETVLSPVSHSITVIRNSPLILNCTVPTSLPPAVVNWYRGDHPVAIDDRISVTLSGRLVFSYTVSSDQAIFHCKVRNILYGSEFTTDTYLVSINSPSTSNPALALINDSLPTSQTVMAGTQVQLECFGIGRPIPIFKWSKNGSPLTAEGNQQIEMTQNGRVLTINDVALSDAGEYKCTIAQGNNEIQRTSHLTVLDPPHIVEVFDDVTQLASLSINISCRAEGTPPINWLWLNNTDTLQQSPSIKFTEDGLISTLTIDSLDFTNSGILQCIAYNDISRDSANNALIVKTQSITFDEQPNDVLAFVSTNVVLPCEATSYPFPVFAWLRNNNALDLDQRHVISSEIFNGTLTISSVTKADTGTYRCSVESIPGIFTLSTNSLVKVIDYPQLIANLESNRIVPEGHDVMLECAIATITNINIDHTWLKDNNPINSTRVLLHTNGSLFITHFNPTLDAGKYTCSVTLTAVGSNAQPLHYSVGHTFLSTVPPTVPSPPLYPIITTTTSNSSHVQWSAPLDNGSLPILHYVIQLTEISPCSNSTQVNYLDPFTALLVVVDSLKPFHNYEIQIFAVNSKGQSNASDVLIFVTKEAAPSSAPCFITVNGSVKVNQLNVYWRPPTCVEKNGVIVNYTVKYWSLNKPPVSITTSSTNITLYDLEELTHYSIKIAASTRAGTGPFSDVVIARTNLANPPDQPTNVTRQIINCTTLHITWNTVISTTNNSISYVIATSTNLTYNNISRPFYDLHNFTEGTSYIIYAMNDFGISNETLIDGVHKPSSCFEVTPTSSPTSSSEPFYQQDWFIYAVAGGGTGIMIILIVIGMSIICFMCGWCYKKNRNKPTTAQSSNKLQSTVLDRMMQVEALSEGSVPSEYAELNVLVNEVAMSSNVSEMGTLTSHSSTLRSKYQYKSPMEQEEENQRMRLAGNHNTISQPRTNVEYPPPLPQQRTLHAPNPMISRQRSASPTDTVSSFEYESHMSTWQKTNRSQNYPGENRHLNNNTTNQRLNDTAAGNRKLTPTFRKLPDLALMTAIPQPSAGSGSSTPSLNLPDGEYYQQPRKSHQPSPVVSQKHAEYHDSTNDHVYQQPRAINNKYSFTAPRLGTQMSLV